MEPLEDQNRHFGQNYTLVPISRWREMKKEHEWLTGDALSGLA